MQLDSALPLSTCHLEKLLKIPFQALYKLETRLYDSKYIRNKIDNHWSARGIQ